MDISTSKSPYNICIGCKNLGVTCDGPNFIAMTPESLMEWCRLRKQQLGLSNAKLAELSDIPKGTIDRLLAGRHSEYKLTTIQPMMKTLVGGSWGQFPCANPGGEADEALKAAVAERDAEISRLNALLDSANQKQSSALDELRAEDEKKISYLKNHVTELKRALKHYKIFALILLALIVGILFVDVLFGNVGWFRY